MKAHLAVLAALIGFGDAAVAEDKNGLRVLVTKKTIDRSDGVSSFYSREINRTMALKAVFKNISSKDMAAGKVDCSILIRRWGLMEVGSLERYTKSIDLAGLKTAQDFESIVGEYRIGGHMHGNSDHHVDQIVGWKISVEQNGKKTDFLSNSNFESLNKSAKDATR